MNLKQKTSPVGLPSPQSPQPLISEAQGLATSEPMRPPRLPSSLAQLDDGVDQLHKTICILEDRLRWVSRIEPTQDKENFKSPAPPQSAHERVEHASYQLQAATARICELLRLLEV